MSTQILITGAGIVSAIGVGRAETLASLQAGQIGVRPMKYLASRHRDIPVGEVQLTNDQMADLLGVAPDPLLTRTALMGRLALREALEQAHLLGNAEAIARTHFISATTVGGMDRREMHHRQEPVFDPVTHARIAIHSCGTSTEVTAAQFGPFASLSTVSTACSSATNAIMTGANMLRLGLADIVVVGGSECLSVFHLNGFNTLMILDRQACRPFDRDRAGLNLGEGAAYLVLERADSARQRGVEGLCEVSGYGNACDAFHQTASSPEGEGAYRAMQAALAMAGLQPADIQYVNAHGTGTPNNDESETHALRRVFGQQLPPISSTKGFTGHTTSASGSIESVICMLALQHQFLPISANWQTPMDDGIVPVTDPRPLVPIRHILSNAFGFGGNDSSLILSLPTPHNLITSQPHNLTASQPHNLITSQPHNLTTSIYVRAAQQVSIQAPLSEQWLSEPQTYAEPFVPAVNPSFRDFIAPNEARRMGGVLKRALVTALSVLRQTGVEHPDAIITGTCFGCMDCTERFLDQVIQNGEEMLSPTHFMQSTHNTVGSTLGIYTHTHGYNTTYSQGGVSFELAVLDAWMQMQQGQISTALVGGHDEMVPAMYEQCHLAGYVGQPGMVPCSEVAMSALLSVEPTTDALCQLAGIRVLHNPTVVQTQQQLSDLLHGAGLTSADVSAVMLGTNGQAELDARYARLVSDFCPDLPLLRYKHLFGETYTVPALGFYAAAQALHQGEVPEVLYASQSPRRCASLQNLLLLNLTADGDLTFILLRR